jgi:hypothetical protein
MSGNWLDENEKHGALVDAMIPDFHSRYLALSLACPHSEGVLIARGSFVARLFTDIICITIQE